MSAGISAAGGLNFGITKDITQTNNIGYSMQLNLNEDDVTLAPTVNYKVTPKIHASCSASINQKMDVRSAVGIQYQIS